MITWLRSIFAKRKELKKPKIVDRPSLIFMNAIEGKKCELIPQKDITPYEVAQITNLLMYLLINQFADETRLNTKKFIEDNGLVRHFSPISDEN